MMGSVNVQRLRADLLMAQLCDRYKVLPSAVLAEDFGLLMRTWNVQRIIDEWRNKKAK